jgi:hypothetical protein
MQVTETEKRGSRSTSANRAQQLWLAVAAWAFVLSIVALTISMQRPPAPRDAGAPPAEFSSARAMQHLSVITRETHPIGSPAHAAVREYIVRELVALGLAPEVQRATVASKNPYRTVAADVQNVVARMPGTSGDGQALMLAAHYDSVLHSFGASDDGAGVVTLLEAARALKAGPALRNDVIFLFTDGEELGLLGARAFVAEHRWAKDVKVALNFEARGSGGPVFMFETSEGNGQLIDAVAEAAPSPFASSLMYQLYRFLPNDTDLTVFKKAGIAGLNFAYVDGLSHYHTPLDNLETIDRGSVQHHGSYALALARHFGAQNLAAPRAADAVYFDIFGLKLITYSQAWVLPLALLGALGFVALMLYGLRRGRLKVSGVLLGFVALLSSIVASAVSVEVVWRLLRGLAGGAPASSNESFLLVGFAALAIAVTAIVYLLFGKRASAGELMAGALFFWVLMALASSLMLPGVSYLFTWPLLFGLIGLGYMLARGGEEARGLSPLVVACLHVVPALVLLSATIYLLFIGLRLELPALLVVLQVLLLGLLVPHLRIAARASRWLLPATALAASLVFICVGAFVPGQSRPPSDVVFYSSDADSGEALWASTTGPTEWSSQFFAQGSEMMALTGRFPNTDGKYLVSKAPAVQLPSDELEVLGEKVSDGVRTINLRITSPRGARVVSLYAEPGSEIRAATIGGKRLEYDQAGDGRRWWELTYGAFPREGAEIVLETKTTKPFQVKVVSQSDGLPGATQAAFRGRTAHSIPARNSDTTNVTRTFVLDANASATARLRSE